MDMLNHSVSHRFRLLALFLTLVFLVSLLRPDMIPAQEEEDIANALTKARHYYEAGKYQEALDELVPLISRGQEYEDLYMVEIYKYLAFCNAAFGKWELVKKQFKRALAFGPHLKLDPVFTSPKIREVFETARKEFLSEEQQPGRARRPGLVSVSANVSGADVYLNGMKVGVVPMPTPKKVKAGRYKVEVKKRGYSSWEKVIEVRPGIKSNLQAELTRTVARKPWYKKAWVWAVIAAAAGGAATGAYLVGSRGEDTGPEGDLTIYY